jgi:hypothetical protein
MPAVYAFLARREGDQVAVVINLGDEAVTDYGLSLADGVVCAASPVSAAYADGIEDIGGLAAPEVDAAGGFSGWRPIPVLPAFSTLVLDLGEPAGAGVATSRVSP